MKEEILEFIKRRFPKDCNWTTGNCYYFATILHERFPGGTVAYDVIYGHFVYKYEDTYYDWNGIVDMTGRLVVEWNSFEDYDKSVKERVERDCIL